MKPAAPGPTPRRLVSALHSRIARILAPNRTLGIPEYAEALRLADEALELAGQQGGGAVDGPDVEQCEMAQDLCLAGLRRVYRRRDAAERLRYHERRRLARAGRVGRWCSFPDHDNDLGGPDSAPGGGRALTRRTLLRWVL